MHRSVLRGLLVFGGDGRFWINTRVVVANGHGGKWNGVDLFSPSTSIFVFATYKKGETEAR